MAKPDGREGGRWWFTIYLGGPHETAFFEV
jgi:hypothetical protein